METDKGMKRERDGVSYRDVGRVRDGWFWQKR